MAVISTVSNISAELTLDMEVSSYNETSLLLWLAQNLELPSSSLRLEVAGGSVVVLLHATVEGAEQGVATAAAVAATDFTSFGVQGSVANTTVVQRNVTSNTAVRRTVTRHCSPRLLVHSWSRGGLHSWIL